LIFNNEENHMVSKRDIARMDVDDLLKLRSEIADELVKRRDQISKTLDSIAPHDSNRSRSRGSPMKGRKVPPKYKGPHGELWAGRGAKPRWLTALLRKGRKLESFRIKHPH
jgi:DNA-binding protein H-NS